MSKEKNQKKTAIYWTVVGAFVRIEVQPHGAVHKSHKKETSFSSINLGRNWFFLFFSFVLKEKNQKKTAIYWTVVGAFVPIEVHPHGAVHKSHKKETSFSPINLGRSWFFLFFSFVSKEKNQKKTTIYWTVVGAFVPIEVQPHGAVHKSHKKRNQLFTHRPG